MQTQADIPARLIAPAESALAWLNAENGTDFELTGLVDTDAALAANPGDPIELSLILCDGELCTREQVQVTASDNGYDISALEPQERLIPPLLDPPAGLREKWLDEQRAKHKFILLIFYRGRW